MLQRKVRLRAAYNPEVVGSSHASATIKSPEIVRFQDLFALVEPKATPGYAGGIKIAFSEE